MAERLTSNTIIIIFTTIIVICSVVILVQQAEANIMFWTLRPSESTALDIVSKYAALAGTTGEVVTDYKSITENINYDIYSSGKMVCVISRKEETGAAYLKTINCYSAPFEVSIPAQDEEYERNFHLCFWKEYDPLTEGLDIDTKWEDPAARCI